MTKLKIIAKKVDENRGYLLGKSEHGDFIYLCKPSWDCGWYWGFGYLQGWKRSTSTDFTFHSHWDSTMINQCHTFNDIESLTQTVLDYNDNWALAELMRSFYILKETAGLFGRGGAHLAENACRDLLKNEDKAKEINQVLLPAIFKKIDEILTPIPEAV